MSSSRQIRSSSLQETLAQGSGQTRRAFLGTAVVAGVVGSGSLLEGSHAADDGRDGPRVPGVDRPVKTFVPGTPLGPDQMRISFLGTSFLPRIAQECNSVYVELGNGDDFVFDFGSGVSAKYVAMGIPPSRMTRVFLTHLHADHMSDLTTLYCFGPSQDRKTPLYVYGPSGDTAAEGTRVFCRNLKKLTRWHREGFSFLPTGLKVGGDGYDLIATELPYMETGVAYHHHGVTITHFPAIHDRDGSISYKLEWNGLSMVFSGDTKPNDYMLRHGRGVDVLIHEMVVPVDVWAAKNSGLTPEDDGWDQAVAVAQEVQDSSHTPEPALGYILGKTRPRLGIATHFQVNDDTVGPALDAVRTWYQGEFAFAIDGFVVTLSKTDMELAMTHFDDFSWYPKPKLYPPKLLADPKYDGPYAQLNDRLLAHAIPKDVYEPPPTA